MTTSPIVRRSVDEVLAGARARLTRLTPAETEAACRTGAVVVDIRPADQLNDLSGAPRCILEHAQTQRVGGAVRLRPGPAARSG